MEADKILPEPAHGPDKDWSKSTAPRKPIDRPRDQHRPSARMFHFVRVFGIGEKSELDGPACSIPAAPVISIFPFPRSSHSSAAAISESFITSE